MKMTRLYPVDQSEQSSDRFGREYMSVVGTLHQFALGNLGYDNLCTER